MSEPGATGVDSAWTRQVRAGKRPASADLVDHLQAVHREHPGFTESCAWACRNLEGRNSYEWLASLAASSEPTRVVDIMCGSGVLTEQLWRTAAPDTAVVGIDMSVQELDLARARVQGDRGAPGTVEIGFVEALAQSLPFLADRSVDAVLCHWALTLVSPTEPVLAEAERILKPGGVFGAIIDGDMSAAPGYEELNDLIYTWARRACPGYGDVDLGDPRVRTPATLIPLMKESFHDAEVTLSSDVVRLRGTPAYLTEQAVGFFYASYVVDDEHRPLMFKAVEDFFVAGQDAEGTAEFAMPIRLVVARTAA